MKSLAESLIIRSAYEEFSFELDLVVSFCCHVIERFEFWEGLKDLVCDLYCGGVADVEKCSISYLFVKREKNILDNLGTLLPEKDIQADLVCCLQHLQSPTWWSFASDDLDGLVTAPPLM
ncbi:hypothetical protein Goshw_025780, partial [Gossypium schwendimanii]|nr:hypothetical protein [Gossypium schwendimanii]